MLLPVCQGDWYHKNPDSERSLEVRQQSATSNLEVNQTPACHNDYADSRNGLLVLSRCLKMPSSYLDFPEKDLELVLVYET